MLLSVWLCYRKPKHLLEPPRKVSILTDAHVLAGRHNQIQFQVLHVDLNYVAQLSPSEPNGTRNYASFIRMYNRFQYQNSMLIILEIFN